MERVGSFAYNVIMALKIQLPENVSIVVKTGQKVDFSTLLFKKSIKKNVKIPLAQILEIKPEKIFFSLKKAVGEEVHKGEILAVKKNLLGQKKFYSEHDGLLKDVNHEEGTLTISVESEDQQSANCFFKGEIEEVDKNVVLLKVQRSKSFDLVESSRDFGGEIYYVKTDDINVLKTEDFDSKILAIKKVESYNQVRLEVMGASGFITLEALSQNPSINYARIKSEKDWNEIIKSNLSYCLVNGKKIHFYA